MTVLVLTAAATVPAHAGSIVPWGDDSVHEVSDAPTGTDFVAIAAGWGTGYALRADGSIVAWGLDYAGQVSDVPAGNDFVAIDASDATGFALRANGSITAWGDDSDGLKSGCPTETGFIAIAAQTPTAFALRVDGSIVAWGTDIGTVSEKPTEAGFTAIAAGFGEGFALRADGSIVAWPYIYPDLPTGTGFIAIAAGDVVAFALRADGSIVAWGDPYSPDVFNAPTETGFVAITNTGASVGYALRADGSIAAWGYDYAGLVSDTPTGPGFTAIANGGGAAFALYDANTAPTANAGLDQSIHAGTTVNLDGSLSFDDNTATTALQYSWTLTEKPVGSGATLTNADTATPSFVADLDGDYVVQLVVTDEGALASAPDEVLISSFNQAPTAYATATTMLPLVGAAVALDGSASTDPDRDPLTYSWTVTSAPAGSGAGIVNADAALASFTPNVAGDYEITLTVSDFLGAGTPASVTFVASTAPQFAEEQAIATAAIIAALPSSAVTNSGNQHALENFLSQAVSQLHHGNVAAAIDKLNKAIERTDGCILRTGPDDHASGFPRDWITDCVVQESVYYSLTAALNALQP